jgi:thermostable 8-oxoguanine DNA glycosylase
MINPTEITNYNRTEAELEEFLMFAILVAGKTAKTQAKKLEDFLSSRGEATPFEYLEYLFGGSWIMLRNAMRHHKLGQYDRIEQAFKGILMFKGKLKTVTVQDLELVKGIGPKTARFFVLHSQLNAQIACLDVHILKWLDDLSYPNIPLATPSKNRYGIIEQYFLKEARNRGVSPADLDLRIWKSYSQKALA